MSKVLIIAGKEAYAGTKTLLSLVKSKPVLVAGGSAATAVVAKPIFTMSRVPSAMPRNGSFVEIHHGLEEIVVPERITPNGAYITPEGGTISHPAPIRPPKGPYVEIEGQYVSLPKGARQIRVEKINSDKYGICWINENNSCDCRIINIDRNCHIKQHYSEIPPRYPNMPAPKPVELPKIQGEHFLGFKKPKGAVSCCRKTLGEGKSEVVFHDKDGNLLRKIKCENGYPVEYTNYEYKYTNIRGAIQIAEDGSHVPIEGQAYYDIVKEENTYKINDKEVVETIQKRTTLTRECQNIENPVTTEVRRIGSVESGQYTEIVKIQQGDKYYENWYISRDGHKHRLKDGGLGFGITPQETREISSDPYLSVRYYTDTKDFANGAVKLEMDRQGLRNPNLHEITYKEEKSNPLIAGHYDRHSQAINFSPGWTDAQSSQVINTAAHETRHGIQYDLVEDLQEGRLPKEMTEEVEAYRKGLKNYSHEGPEYWNNPVEIDARREGQARQRIYRQNGDKINSIFA